MKKDLLTPEQAKRRIKCNVEGSVSIPYGEKDFYHLRLRWSIHKEREKKYEHLSKIQSFSPADFKSMNANGRFMKQYDAVEVVHDPTKKYTVVFVDEIKPKKEVIETDPLRKKYADLFGKVPQGATNDVLKASIDAYEAKEKEKANPPEVKKEEEENTELPFTDDDFEELKRRYKEEFGDVPSDATYEGLKMILDEE